MNIPLDKRDDNAELQAVMGDYFAALLRDTDAQTVVVEAAAPVIESLVAQLPETALAETESHDELPQPVNEPEYAEAVAAAASVIEPTSTVLTPAPLATDAQLATAPPPMEAAEVPAESVLSTSAAEPGYQLIRIGGLTLGVPMQAIAEVVTAAAPWTPACDTRAFVLGSYSGGSQIYTVVDTAALLVPGSALQTTAAEKCAVLLAGQGWALACDGIGERITPDPAQVNWRGAQGKRPWLAGTVREPSCALLDIPELLRLLTA